MDRISLLSDDLLVKILSFLSTKEAVSTSVLSKQWEFLWMWLPRLEFTSPWGTKPGHREFIYKNLPLHRAPFIECLRLVLLYDSLIEPEDIKLWVEIAVSRHVRELIITIYSPSLKTLKLEFVTFVDGLEQLLSVCPVLEDLSVLDCSCDDDMKDLTITVPSLQSLSLWYEIDTPNLKYLKLVDSSSNEEHEHYSPLIKNMPKLTEAYVDVGYSNLNSIIGSITSAKRLTICSVGVYGGDGFVFKNLEKLKLCLCKMTLSKLFVQLLKDSPKLQVLDISGVGVSFFDKLLFFDHYIDGGSGMVSWNQPSSVPKCLLSSLQIFNWSDYFGRSQDKDIVVYILRNACHLKMVTIEWSEESVIPPLDMLKELAFSSRASTTCKLVFNCGC
ncbi:PREDICTED: putative FBD-associated F-box protein At5g38570 [Camelina sativa]|uniref:FBD-associated F-box protein At5g38570 n=1 Tax=Camelina sativa TaxID=90675 RepID=A0ABM1QHV2_CAMSA|nr:PREDICTED: putative FBD-associated F-box protein At5g38570 [Camelina sativa]